ncbi:CocE/NonD family hydrolase [Nocardia paucivorans]|uniref:CocE/NonD family hydrolase n=1 Tax=Nocardia paucivorans TaxID=114259 RepID=UPI00059528E7|nr:CocE/NonD family hydrolase [Nocardia paucivorans]
MSRLSVPRGLVLLLGLVTVLAVATPFAVRYAPPAQAQLPFRWWQEFFDSTDGVRMHADVLRPLGLADDVRTPVILTVSPYRAHGGYIAEPRLEGGPTVVDLDVEKFLRAGYTYVIADLRGFGGSSGCPDYGGPGERSDVKTAVEWAASQPWSTGKVGLAGLSYEGRAALMGLVTKPKGLAAVASFAPTADPYSYAYMQGIPWRFAIKPVSERGVRPGYLVGYEHSLIAALPGHPTDPPEYHANVASISVDCYAEYAKQIMNPDGNTAFWRDRNLIPMMAGNTIPLFLGQGFSDFNTRPWKVFDVWKVQGPGEHKAWFGMWGHRDCHEPCGGPDFNPEILAFFDRHVAGRDVTVPGPRVSVGRSDGAWRSEQSWPPSDAVRVPIPLRTGRYMDRGLPPGPDREIWTVSEPLPRDMHLSGLPTATVRANGPANATVAIEVYDISPNNTGIAVTRGIAPVSETARIELTGHDWLIPAGHRLGVKITDVVDDQWAHTPVFAPVNVEAAELELPVLRTVRPADLPSGLTPKQHEQLGKQTVALDPAILDNARVPLNLNDLTVR